MRRGYFILIGIVILLGVFACDYRKSAIKDFKDLVDNIENNYKLYTDEDWEAISISYYAIEEELAKHEYTDEELREISRLRGKYVGFLSKYSLDDLERQINDIPIQIEGAIEGFMEVFSD